MSDNDENNLMTEADLESVDMAENLLAGNDGSSGSSSCSNTASPTATSATPEATATTVGLQPIGSERSHEQYVSLDISSRDSDEDKKKSVYHKTTKVRGTGQHVCLSVENCFLTQL